MEGIELLMRKGIGLLIMKGIGLLIRKGIRILVVKYCFSQTMSRTLAKFGVLFDKATPLVHFPNRLKRPRNTAGPASNNNNTNNNNNNNNNNFLQKTPCGIH